MRRTRGPLLLVAALLAGSCGSTTDTTAVEPATTTTAAPSAPTTTLTDAEIPEEGLALSFVTADGLTLEGRRFGAGPDFVVLAHMRPAAMDSWFDLAATLAAQGYSAIAFNFRGYGGSEGSGYAVDVDTVAAIDHAVSLGAERIFLIGASMGGTGVIAAAAQRPVAGIVTLSAPAEFEGVDALTAAATLQAPALLVSAEDNLPYPDDAAALAAASPSPAEAVVLSGDRHGTDLFAEHDPSLTDRIVAFLDDLG